MLSVLIVEDDLMIADMTEEFLVASGYAVCGIARSIKKAVDLAKRYLPDIAIVDLRLSSGELGTDVAAQLKSVKRIGILFATGNVTQFHLTTDDGDACLVKPYMTGDLLKSLEIVMDIVTNDKTSLPLPRGLKILGPPISSDGRKSHVQ